MKLMTREEQLLIIGGTGRDAGKSTLAALLISRYKDPGVTGVKITPHPHPDMAGLTLMADNNGFQVFEEKDNKSEKDSSRMLRAGALKVFLIVTAEENLGEAFATLKPMLPKGLPVICESPALRRFVEPDLFILMVHGGGDNSERKNIDDLIPLADLSLTLSNLDHNKADIIGLDADNRWYLKS